jgi:hypothetical protein
VPEERSGITQCYHSIKISLSECTPKKKHKEDSRGQKMSKKKVCPFSCSCAIHENEDMGYWRGMGKGMGLYLLRRMHSLKHHKKR